MPDPKPTESAETTETATGSAGGTEFDGEFDADRAKRLIENLRADAAKAKARVQEFERAAQERADAEKTELQKAIERAERAEKLAAEHVKAEAKRAALKAAGLADDFAEFVSGDTAEEMAERAKALAARIGSKPQANADLSTKPTPKLTPGHESSEDAGAGFDPIASADDIYKRLRG